MSKRIYASSQTLTSTLRRLFEKLYLQSNYNVETKYKMAAFTVLNMYKLLQILDAVIEFTRVMDMWTLFISALLYWTLFSYIIQDDTRQHLEFLTPMSYFDSI